MTFGVPVVKNRVLNDGWQVSFYEEFEGILFASRDLHAEIVELIQFVQEKRTAAGFRREITIKAYPFLVAVRPEEKTLYIGTRRLSRELSILKVYEASPVILDKDTEKAFFALKEHVGRISGVSCAQYPTEIEFVTHKHQLPQLWNEISFSDVNEESKRILKELVKKVGNYQPSLFEKVSDYGLTLTAQYDLIRVHLLKFLAVLPSLDHDKTGDEVKRNLLESLRRLKEDSEAIASQRKKGSRPIPFYLTLAFSFVSQIASILSPKLLATVVRYLVRMMAKRFIAGESISTSHKTLRDLRETQRDATLDQLGELVVSAKEADEYFEKVLQLIHGLKEHNPKGSKNSAGILCSHVSIKVSALSHDFRPQAFEATYAKVAPRLRRILQEAAREEVFIQIDAEHHHYRDLVLAIYSKVLLETPELSDYDQTGIVVQAYLRDGSDHLREVVELARKRGQRMRIRIVKGAYWDAETIEGAAHQFIPPQFLNKEESDIHFRQLLYLALKHHEYIQLAIASHNLQDHAFVEALRQLRFPQSPVVEHQCLHMTYEALSHGLAKMGWPTRNYMPIGNLLVGMAYLVRRIMENSSQVGVLSIMRSHQKAAGLVSPIDVHEAKKKSQGIVFDSFITELKSDFTPVRPLRLFLPDERQDFLGALKQYEQKLTFSQEEFKKASGIKVTSSSRPELLLGSYEILGPGEIQSLVEKTEVSLKTSWWAHPQNALLRVSILLRAADQMLLKRNELSALIVYEAGKTMTEALADVDEAIDFINFYARQEIELQLSGEKYSNRGVIAVIAPWNFPLAIPCGMAVAPLVAGNAVILKPAEQTPLIGRELYDLLLSAGVPQDVFKLVQGDGEVVGAPLVQHPRVAGVVFTGSKGVGQWIYREAADKLIEHYRTGTLMQKKIITEMGGKNAIIVTNNCELDETISGILYAAFGHAGQKCSAASRVIVHREVKDALIHRLVEAMKDLKVGESFDPSTAINPVITEFDQTRIRKNVEEAKDEAIRSKGRILLDRSFEKLPGFCVGPALFELPAHQAAKKESWAQREIFGPVIHIVEYESLIEAVELFNGTEYALTGGIYSQSQDDIDFLIKFLRAGNLYVNRPNTGARVAIEPFGGFKLSGTGPKAGGSDYLPQFHFVDGMTPQKLAMSWAQDTGYNLMVPKPSLISVKSREQRFAKFTQEILANFEHLTGETEGKTKSDFAQFSNWAKNNLSGFLTEPHLNFVIPGQLSYNDKSLVKDACLFVGISGRPSLKALKYFSAAVGVGTGLSVVAITQEGYSCWKMIVDLAWKCGVSKSHLDITLTSPEKLKQIFSTPSYSVVFADAYSSQHEVYQGVLSGEALNQDMRLILSDVDGISHRDPKHILEPFVWTRSLAINTMRHGAPLELQ